VLAVALPGVEPAAVIFSQRIVTLHLAGVGGEEGAGVGVTGLRAEGLPGILHVLHLHGVIGVSGASDDAVVDEVVLTVEVEVLAEGLDPALVGLGQGLLFFLGEAPQEGQLIVGVVQILRHGPPPVALAGWSMRSGPDVGGRRQRRSTGRLGGRPPQSSNLTPWLMCQASSAVRVDRYLIWSSRGWRGPEGAAGPGGRRRSMAPECRKRWG
jgi:hypothetical protein